MQHISEIPKKPTSSTTPIGPHRPRLTDEDARFINYVFGRITHNCTAWRQSVVGDAQSWSDGYKRELVDSLHQAGINHPDQVEVGIQQMKAHRSPFMPTPSEFVEFCKARVEQMHKPAALLTAPVADPNFARQQLQKMRDVTKWSRRYVAQRAPCHG